MCKRFVLRFLLSLIVFFGAGVSAAERGLYDLSFMTTDAQVVSLDQYRGKVILLNFWATWCPPCIKEMPSMQRLYEQFDRNDFEIVAISAGESVTSVESFLLELGAELTFPILIDEKGLSFEELGIRGLPTSYLFDRNGELIKSFVGGREWDSQSNKAIIASAIVAG